MSEPNRPRENWGSRIGVILAVMGSAIGLGNFLRFPGLAAQYGGGHFMIPYFVALLLLGLPIAWAEWALGRYGGRHGFNSTPGIFYALWRNKAAPYLGVLGLIIPVGIYMYYVFIESWCLYYAYQYLQGGLSLGKNPKAYADFFGAYTGAAGHGALLDGGISEALGFLLVCFALNFLIVYRGLAKGIEIICKYAIPLLFLCALIVLVRVLTLGTPDAAHPTQNVLSALGNMWNPGVNQEALWTGFGVYLHNKTLWQSLSDAQMWLDAAGQIFFSLSVGFGIIVTYASYLKKDDDVILSGTAAASGNIFAEVALGGMITIPAAFLFLGPFFLANTDNLGTFSIGFIALPNVFANMPLGNIMGFLWFFLLFLAAVTSSLSMLQPAVAFFEEGLGMSRRRSVALLGFITLLGAGFIAYFSGKFTALSVFDDWIGTIFIYVLATVTIIIFGWVMGVKKGLDEAHRGADLHLPRWIWFILKFVAPLYLLIIFAVWLVQKLPDKIAGIAADKTGASQLSALFIGLLLVFFLVMITIAVRRWAKRGEPVENMDKEA